MKIIRKTLLVIAILIVSALVVFGGISGIYSLSNDKSILKIVKNDNTGLENVAKQTMFDKNDESFVLQKQGRGAVCIEQSSRRVLYDENMHDKCYPASTTKILTAIVVIERSPLDKVVKVPKEAEGVEGSSIYLKAGQEITVGDLLLGMMLRSGNDAAVALAIETGGSVENFAALMNQKAKSVGAVDSHFSNPHGLDDKTHYTSAYDMALITANAYENADFCRIANTKQAKITVDGEARYIANKNKLLKTYDGANGVKTGYTKRDGRCFVGGAKRDGMQLISVVFNHSDMWNDTVRMLDFAFDNYAMIPIEEAIVSNGKNFVNCPLNALENYDWSQMRYPMRKDGSEKLIMF